MIVNFTYELQELEFIDISKSLMTTFSNNEILIFSIISIFRRTNDNDYSNKISKDLLFTFLTLLDYYYVSLKELDKNELLDENKKLEGVDFDEDIDYESEIKNKVKHSDRHYINNKEKIKLAIYKELMALLANLMTIEINLEIFYEHNFHLILIDTVSSFIGFPKIVKIALGALVNSTNNLNVLESLSKVPKFLDVIELVLEEYKESSLIIDYLLKLLINVFRNSKISFKYRRLKTLSFFLKSCFIYFTIFEDV